MTTSARFYCLFWLIFFSNNIFSQTSTLAEPGCQDDGDAAIGIDRKAWTTNFNEASESYQLNFEIPEDFLECHVISSMQIDINGFSVDLNNIMSGCFVDYRISIADCVDNDPISCPLSGYFYDEWASPFGFSETINNNDDIFPGMPISVDIAIVSDASNSACDLDVMTQGFFEASFEICVTVFYEPDEVEDPLDLGDDIIICPGETIDLEGPDDWESYQWDGPVDSDEQLLENAVAGIYELQVFDVNGCQSSDEIEIIEDEAITIEFNLNNPLSTCGTVNETLIPTVNTITQNPLFDYEWEDPTGQNSSANQIQLTQSGIYMLTVTDIDTDCTATASFEVNGASSIANAQIDSLNIDTYSSCDNETFILEAFIPFTDLNQYTFEWVFMDDTTYSQNITPLESGQYILNLYNNLGCPPSSDTILYNIQSFSSAGQNGSSTLCPEETLVLSDLLSIDAAPNGLWESQDPITIDLDDNLVPSGFIGTATLLYIVNNDLPCVNDTATFEVEILNETLNAGNDVTATGCTSSMLDLSSLIDGDMGGSFTDEQFNLLSSNTIDGAVLGQGSYIYNYIVQNANCGSDTAIINIEIADAITTNITESICEGDFIEIESQIFDENNPSGTITLTSVTGCDSILNINIDFIAPSVGVIDDEYCSSEIVTIEGETFDFNNPFGQIFLPNASSAGCDSIINVNLNFVDGVSTDFIETLCEGESLVIGGISFDEVNSSGQIVLNGASVEGCDSIINIDLSFAATSMSNFTEILCDNESIEINGETFDQSNPSGTQTLISSAGCDSILTIQLDFIESTDSILNISLCESESIDINGEIFDANNLSGNQSLLNAAGCDSTLTIQVEILESSTLDIQETLCANETFDFQGVTYDINNPSDQIIIANNAGCDSIINIALDFTMLPERFESREACQGEEVILFGEAITVSGIYQDTVSSLMMNECDSILTVEINFIDCNADVISELVTPINCFGDQATIAFNVQGAATQEYNYLITDQDNTEIASGVILGSDRIEISDLGAGTYSIEVTDSNGEILANESLNVEEPDELNVNLVSNDIDCFGSSTGSIIAEVTGGTAPYIYSWANGVTSNENSGLLAGVYTVTILDSNGCSIEATANIIAIDAITAVLDVTNSSCEEAANGTIMISSVSGGVPTYSFSINDGEFSSDSIFTNLGPDNYEVFIQDSNGCLETFNAAITVENNIALDAPNNITIEQGDSINVNLTLNFMPSAINWSPAEGLSCNDCLNPIINPLVSTTYNITMVDENGCSISTELRVEVIIKDPEVYYPNIFSLAQEAGNNNIFKPDFDPNDGIGIESFQIFDRWGNLVHNEENQTDLVGWDGFFNDNPAQVGVYIFKFVYTLNGRTVEYVGDITLIR